MPVQTSRKTRICFSCLSFQVESLGAQKKLVCRQCGIRISEREYSQQLQIGKKVALFGVSYPRAYQKQMNEHGRIVEVYSLSDPTVVEAVVAYFALKALEGLPANMTWDLIKVAATKLYRTLRSPKKLSLDDKQRSADFLFGLIGSSEQGMEYLGYIQSYSSGQIDLHPTVRSMTLGESMVRRLEIAKLKDPNIFVYVAKKGSKYHKQNCASLKKPTDRQRIRLAIEKGLTPCSRCKPVDLLGIDRFT